MISRRLILGLWLVVVRLTFLSSWNPTTFFPHHSKPSLEHRHSTVINNMTPKCETEHASINAQALTVKRLLCVRHGISVANEWMSRPGNTWGDPNFRDDGKPDTPLSERGRQKTEEFLKRQLKQTTLLQVLDDVELVLISPLTRCLETFHYGVEPILVERLRHKAKNIPILALPLLRERVYTTSDTGRPASVLAKEFPAVDFSECPADDSWWYTGDSGEEEWRPHGQNQWYGVPGEPEDGFEARMKELDEWIGNRPEKTILMVTHWGVLRHLTNGTQFLNAEAKILEHSFCPVQRKSVVAHL